MSQEIVPKVAYGSATFELPSPHGHCLQDALRKLIDRCGDE